MSPTNGQACDSRNRARAYATHFASAGFFMLFLSAAGGAFAFAVDRARFVHAYWVAFGSLTTLGLGALFFTLLHHVVGARWSVESNSRIQTFVGLLPWCAVLYLPAVYWAPEIFAGMQTARVTQGSLSHPMGLFELPWFHIRAAIYWLVLVATALRYGNPRLYAPEVSFADTLVQRARRDSGPALLAFAITTTFASFDWFMRLQPSWHSAVFGVYIFSGAVPAALAMLALATLLLESLGITQTHTCARHDISKLLFGFVVFWAYIAFSQYLLIWYAGLAHETPFYVVRFNRSWLPLTLALLLLHFAVPFLALLSAHAKTSPRILGSVSVVVLVAHGVDIYWLIMPALESERPRLSLSDVPPALLIVSAVLLLLSRSIQRELSSPEPAVSAASPEPIAPHFRYTG